MRSPASLQKFISSVSRPAAWIPIFLATTIAAIATSQKVFLSPQPQFQPEKTVTRSHLAELIKAAFDYPTNTSCGDFPDVSPGDRAYVAITTLKCNGIVNGNKHHGYQFLPEHPVTRAEASKFIVNAFNQQIEPSFQLKSQGIKLPFSDITSELGGLENFIEMAYLAGWMKGKNGKFLPQNPLTQTELNQILSRTQIDFHLARDRHEELATFDALEILCLWW